MKWGGALLQKVHGDVPPARVILSRTSSLAKGMVLGNFCLPKGMLVGNFGKKKSNVGNSCIQTKTLAILV